MDNTLTIVIELEGKSVYVSLQDGKVIGGSVVDLSSGMHLDGATLKVTDQYDLCGYPYVILKEEGNDKEGVLV